MKLVDYVVLGIILLILGSVFVYIRKAKKKGTKCIGCPHSESCSGNCSDCSHR